MAARGAGYLKSGGGGGIGKRLAQQLHPPPPNSFLMRRAHTSMYDKNLDDQVRPTIVPDEVIQPPQSDKYWAPHPKTGVFGPAAAATDKKTSCAAAEEDEEESVVLEEKAWFRPTSLEDVEKPHNP